MSFYRYDQDSDVHIVDCGGTVNLETGMTRLRELERELKARRPRDGVARLLIDFRMSTTATTVSSRTTSTGSFLTSPPCNGCAPVELGRNLIPEDDSSASPREAP